MILTALIGVCFFAGVVCVLSIPWMFSPKNSESK